MVPVFKNVVERSTAKNYCPVSLLSVVSKVFEKLVNNRIVDHLEKCGLFLISSMVLGLLDQLQIFSLWYLIELLGLLTGLGLLEQWDSICPRLLTEFGMLVYFTKLGLEEFQSDIWLFGLISSFLSSGRLRVVLDGKSSQEYPVSTGVPQGSILDPTLFLLYINDLPDGVICVIGIYADDAALYSGCD